jgi:hypothetical protein
VELLRLRSHDDRVAEATGRQKAGLIAAAVIEEQQCVRVHPMLFLVRCGRLPKAMWDARSSSIAGVSCAATETLAGTQKQQSARRPSAPVEGKIRSQ